MAVARVTEISSTSTTSFEDAIKTGLERANQTLRNVRSAWIKEQQVRLDGGSISEYQVNMLVIHAGSILGRRSGRSAAVRRSAQSIKPRIAARSTGSPATISSRAASTLSQTSQRRKPRGFPPSA